MKQFTKPLIYNNISGAALVTVLVIVFMIMAIITNITVENYRAIRRMANQKIQTQALSILEAATAFGRAGLYTSGATSKIDTLTDIWAQPLPKSEVVDNIQMSGFIVDEQSKFNINDLVSNGMINQTVLNQFTVLLGYLNIPTAIASNIASYMAAPQYQSDIMNQYAMGVPPDRPAGRPFIDLSELILVNGMQPAWVYKLNQYVTAIPQNVNFSNESSASNESQTQTPGVSPTGTGTILVNINTASPEVISAKSGIPLAVAQRIATIRSSTPFNSSTDITKFLASNGIMLSQNTNQGSVNILVNTLTTSSQYFTIHAIVDSGDYEFRLTTLVFRQNRNGQQWPLILWRHPE